jgi:hypothetical protein
VGERRWGLGSGFVAVVVAQHMGHVAGDRGRGGEGLGRVAGAAWKGLGGGAGFVGEGFGEGCDPRAARTDADVRSGCVMVV